MRGFGRGILIGALIVIAGVLVIFVWHPWDTGNASGLVSCGNGIYVQPGSACPNGSSNGTSNGSTTGGGQQQPTTVVTIAPAQPTQPPVNNTSPSGHAIPSTSSDPPYTTPNGTAICSGDVSVKEPKGTLHSPDNDSTTGEEVAITGGGYTIIFTNSASCTQYQTLTSDQINQILSNIQTSQAASGCGGGCSGQEQTWIFP